MNNLLQEDKGLIKIHRVCVEMNAIWRPTTCHDLGIDGQIEFLQKNSNISTGCIVAVQSKSGPSYFQNSTDDHVKYYAQKKHLSYWTKLNLPVVVILYNPDDGMTLFADAKSDLERLNNRSFVLFDKSKCFCGASRDELISLAYNRLKPSIVLKRLMEIKLQLDFGKFLTGIHFLLSFTNSSGEFLDVKACRFSSLLDLCTENDFFAFGVKEHEFIHRIILSIHRFSLVEDFILRFEEEWYENQIVPNISSPLTDFGVIVHSELWKNIEQYMHVEMFSHLGIKDHCELAKFISDHAQKQSDEYEDWLESASKY